MRNRQFTLVSLIALACGGRVAAQTVEYAQALRVAPGRTDGGLLSQRAEIVVHGVPLPEALALLSEQARVPIAFSASLLPDRTHRVDCPCQAATVADALEKRHVLLVMDTCEHLIDTCARLIRRLLTATLRVCVPTITIPRPASTGRPRSARKAHDRAPRTSSYLAPCARRSRWPSDAVRP